MRCLRQLLARSAIRPLQQHVLRRHTVCWLGYTNLYAQCCMAILVWLWKDNGTQVGDGGSIMKRTVAYTNDTT